MAGSDFENLVFTVAVESSPVDGGLLVGIVLWIAGAPVERTRLASMADLKWPPSCSTERQTTRDPNCEAERGVST